MRTVARFWEKVTRTDGCWLWTEWCNHDGYGRFWAYGKLVTASRFVYEITYGPIPEGMNVLHHCDMPPCVRPEHLYLGTQAKNMADMRERGRERYTGPNRIHRGVDHHAARLSEEQVRSLRTQYAAGASFVELSRLFSISETQAARIAQRKNWAHLSP